MYTLKLVDIVNKKRQLMDEITVPHGLTRAQWQILANIYLAKEDMTQKKLNEVIDVDPSFTARVLDKLEQRGCIKREISKKDRRQRYIHLTKKGERCAKHLVDESQKLNDKILESLSESERKALMLLTDKVHEKIKTLCTENFS